MLAEFEGLRRETEITRGDAMAMENTRIDQLYSKALSLYSKGSVPAGRLALSINGASGEVERAGRADEDRAHGPDRRASGRHRGD